MEKMLRQNRRIIIISIMIFVLLALIIIDSVRKRVTPSSSSIQETITPTTTEDISSSPKSFRTIETAPTLPPKKGLGIDIQSQFVQDSEKEINKIKPFLPFKKDVILSTQQASILIPDANNQENAWTLVVYIFDVDYQVPAADPAYTSNKTLFLQAAKEVMQWIESKKADPKKIIIQWGDKKIIQERSKEWLQ